MPEHKKPPAELEGSSEDVLDAVEHLEEAAERAERDLLGKIQAVEAKALAKKIEPGEA